MDRQLSFTKDVSNVEVRDFYKFDQHSGDPDISDDIIGLFDEAEIVMAIISDPNERLVSHVLETSSRVYILTDNLEKQPFKRLDQRCIVREVPNIKGNVIITENRIMAFDKNMNGAISKDKKSIEYLAALFIRLFWNEAESEQFFGKQTIKDKVFDAPYPPETDKVRFGFDSIRGLLDGSEAVQSSGKRAPPEGLTIMYHVPPKTDIVRSATQAYLVPDSSAPFIRKAGDWLLNFDPDSTDTMTDREKKYAWAIHSDKMGLGDQYLYCRKDSRKNLVGARILDSFGRSIEIQETATVESRIETDLKEWAFLSGLDDLMLMERLEHKNPKISNTDAISCKVVVKVDVGITPHTIKTKDRVYTEQEGIRASIKKKVDELNQACQKRRADDIIGSLSKINIQPESIDDCITTIASLNNLVEKYNGLNPKLDESLLEVKDGKKSERFIDVKPLIVKDPQPLPAFGTLYSSGQRYEYVLTNESNLNEAIKEAEKNHWDNITYHLE